MSKKGMIMEKAIELFAKNSIETTSIQDITNACGISKGAFYLSFKSKEDLLIEIVDYFMKKIISNYNAISEDGIPGEEKLKNYFYYNFRLLEDNYSFISMYMREQISPMNSQIVEKLNEFTTINNETLLTIIRETYGKDVELIKYDLILTIRGLLGSFAEFITTHPQKYDLTQLANVLTEKTNIIAKYSTSHFLNDEIWNSQSNYYHQFDISSEIVMEELKRFIGQYNDVPIIEETLDLLNNELEKPSPSIAILQGLSSNLKELNECSWLIFLIKQYVVKLQKVS